MGDECQEHGAPYHDDGEVEKPLPQAHTIGTHEVYTCHEQENGDENGAETETGVHKVVGHDCA